MNKKELKILLNNIYENINIDKDESELKKDSWIDNLINDILAIDTYEKLNEFIYTNIFYLCSYIELIQFYLNCYKYHISSIKLLDTKDIEKIREEGGLIYCLVQDITNNIIYILEKGQVK